MTDIAAPGGTTAAAGRGRALMARLGVLATFSDERPALTRLFLSPAHKAAALRVARWMAEAGMAVSTDAVGNVVGRYEAAEPGRPALILGSHIDTVRDAGRYDGALGVLAAITAVAELDAAGERLPYALEVIAFGDEEGVRFPVSLTSSRAVAGILDPAVLEDRDGDGVIMRDALLAFGGDPTRIAAVARRPASVLGFLELHIEQGPVLETEGLPVGIVTAINGASRFQVEVSGEAGHAGTVPMGLRKDALAAAAEMVLAVERMARAARDLVATVGRLEAAPGAVNVIAGVTRFTLDARSPSDRSRHEATAALDAEFRAIAARRRVGVVSGRVYDQPATTCSPWLIGELEEAVGRAGIRPLRLASGAGHDGLAMAALCPIGMLFVRCRGGVSHSPAEAVTTEDAGTAVAVLLDLLRHLRLRPS